MRRDRVQALEHQVHAAGDQVVDRGGAAAVGNVDDVGVAHVLEQLAADMAGRAVARRRVQELARILLRVVDHLRHRFERQRRRDREQEVSARRQRDRLKVALDVVGQLRHHVAGDRERTDRPHAERIAVGLGLGGEVETDGQRAAGAVVDHDLLADLLGQLGTQDARDGVGRAAGGLRNDEPDRLVRILRRRAGREHAGEQQQGETKCAHGALPGIRMPRATDRTTRADKRILYRLAVANRLPPAEATIYRPRVGIPIVPQIAP